MPCAPIRLRTFSSSDPEPHARSSKLSMCARLPVAGSCPSRATISERISDTNRSEEHTSELQSLMRISYAVFCLKKKKTHSTNIIQHKTTKLLTQNLGKNN